MIFSALATCYGELASAFGQKPTYQTEILFMRLYTIQPLWIYDMLCRTGSFLSEPWRDAEEWICTDAPAIKLAYDWLCNKMVEHGLLRPAPSIYPIWAWYWYMGEEKPKPDLRHSAYKNCQRDERQVLLTLDVPDNEVLLHDYEAWHYPLNYFHLAARCVSDRFERQCKAAGFPLYSNVPLQDIALHAEVQRSWCTIFDLNACRRLFRRSRAEQAVQATFWTLNAAHVTEAVSFGGLEKRRRLPLPRLQFLSTHSPHLHATGKS